MTAPSTTGRTHGAPRRSGSFTGELAGPWGLLRAGRMRAALADLARLRRAAAEGVVELSEPERAEAALLTVEAELAVGDLARAGRAAEELATQLAGTGRAAMLAHLGCGELADARGAHELAADHFRRAGALPGADVPELLPWRAGAAVALLRTGRRREAEALAGDLLVQAEEAAAPYPLAVALRTVATAAPTRDPFTSLRRAHGLASVVPDHRLAAQIDTDLAGLLLLVPAGASVAQAVTLLRRAEAFAAQEGLWPLHGRIGRLLERAGERPLPLQGEALARLTVAERRVARLAAQGLTNRQIAEHLSVTVKAVEWHLSRVYRKLAIGSRAGLEGILETDAARRSTA